MGSGQPAGSDAVPEVEPERRHGESDWGLTGRNRAGELSHAKVVRTPETPSLPH